MTNEQRRQIYIGKIIDRLNGLDLDLILKIYDLITNRK
jgi:hypothetical protein